MSSSGQIFGGIVGGIAGALIGGAAGAYYGAMIGMTLGGIADPPDGPTVVGPRLSDLTVQTSTLGATLPRGYGTYAVLGNIFWLNKNKLTEVVKKKKTGGKGGPKTTKTKTYSYFATFALGLVDCKGAGRPVATLRRIWIGPDLWYDGAAEDSDTIAASNQHAEMFTFYNGSDTQEPDPLIQADLGVDNTPAWRGRSYIVFDRLPLAKYGNSLAGLQIKVEVIHLGETLAYDYTINSVSYQQWTDCAWNDAAQLFCAVQFGSDKYATSPDGITWTERTLPVTPNIHPCIASNGQIFVAILYYGAAGVYVSANGISWTQVSFSPRDDFGSESYTHIVWTGSRFVVAGDYVQVSETGYVWRKELPPEELGTNWAYTLTWNGETLVMGMASGTNAFYSSPTGLAGSWTHRLTPVLGTNYNRSATIGRKIIINSGASNHVIVSEDGFTFTEEPSATSQPFWDITSDGKNFIGGVGGFYGISPNGIDWTYTQTTGYMYNWGALCNNGAVTVSLPAYGGPEALRILRSTTGNDDTLSNVVQSECLLSGMLEPSDLITTSLTDTVHGYRIGTQGTIRSSLEQLQLAYQFDVRQSGYQIEFIRRPQPSVVTVLSDDLGARPGDSEPTVQITQSREVDSQLTRKLSINHIDREREYDIGSQYAERLNTTAINERTFELSLVLTPTEAAGIAESLIYLQWLERLDVSFVLPASYMALEPGDVVTLPTSDGTLSVRLVTVNVTSDQRVECAGKLNSSAIYTPVAQGASSVVTGSTAIYPLGPTWYQILDIPRLNSAQDTIGFPVAGYGSNDGWPGGTMLRSLDGGTTWDTALELEPSSATVGVAMDALVTADYRVADSAGILHVSLISGELESVSEVLMFAGQNHFAYGVDGRWEIIAARTVTLESDGTYTLQDMLRGRFGSEWAMGLHAAGDWLVLLDSGDLTYLTAGSEAINQSRLYRAITYGRTLETDGNLEHTYKAIAFIPYAPVHFTGSRDTVTGDWSLSWIRRTRIGGDWRDKVDVELGESTEAYEVDIYGSVSYTTVLRTIAIQTATCVYSAAQQTTDFGGPQTTLYVKIYQMSSTIGRGHPLVATITRS